MADSFVERSFSCMVEKVADYAIFLIDPAGVIQTWNPAAEAMKGYLKNEAIGLNFSVLYTDEDQCQNHPAHNLQQAAEHGTFQESAWRQRKDGTLFWALVEIIAIHNDSGELEGFCKLTRDLTNLKLLQDQLAAEKKRAELTLHAIADGVISVDQAGLVDYINPQAQRFTGWSQEEAMGLPIERVFDIVEPRDYSTEEARLTQAEVSGTSSRTTQVLRARDGARQVIETHRSGFPGTEEKPDGAVIVFRDVSESLAMSAKMAQLASHDALTGLPNRVLLTDRLVHEIARAQRNGTNIAVLFLDLDHFKYINDSLGHEVGDGLLKEVAKKLCMCVRAMDTVCRLGGDEFVVLMADNVHTESVASVAEKIRVALSQPHLIAGHELYITTSIGASIFPADGHDVSTLIKSADTAMYHAKENGRNTYQFFDQGMNARAVEKQLIEADLRRALAKQEFILYFQPKLDLETSEIVGTEALLRWLHPTWGVVNPDRFMTIAEECGLIVPIGQWVLEEACSQAKKWRDAGIDIRSIAVNISALEFREKGFLGNVRRILEKTGLSPSCLQLEITESVVMHDAPASAATFLELKKIGVTLAVDDFGTGYSSLSYLKKFPIDVLKIDQSFVREITADHDGAIITAVVAMGNSLNQLVIAEGIENEVQLSFLKASQCSQGQGYFFSIPLAAHDFSAFVQASSMKAANG